MKTVQKTWVSFKKFFWTAHRELQEKSDLTVEDAGMHHANMVRNVVAGLHEVLHQEQAPTENVTTVPEPVDHVENTLQRTQQQLSTKLHKIQEMIKAMQMQYAAASQNFHQ